MAQAYEAVHISEIPELLYEQDPVRASWRPVRIHFGIRSFGTNAYVARAAGDRLFGEHTETDTRHEELYVVASGRATFSLGGEEVDARAGTFVYVPGPETMRSAVAREAGTTVLCFGGTPGEAFEVSPWEQEYEAQASAG
jgi:hypothetical protein